MKKGALAAGFPTDRWTLERIAALIEQEFGVRYHPHYLPRLLRQSGITLPQRAMRRHQNVTTNWFARGFARTGHE